MESIARFILVLQLMSSVRGKLQWEVLERVNNFGQTVKLICLSDACKNTEDCKIRTGWDRHIPDPTITFAVTTDQNNIPATNKYSGCFVQNGFTLEIRNLSKEDLDIKYECSVSSNRSEAKRLLEEDVFKGILQWEVLEQIEEYGQTLKLICLSTSCNNHSCPWKPAWARYAPKFEILLEDVRNQSEVKAGKYSGQIVEKGFTLEIRNVSTADLKYRYQCSLPFNKSDSQVLLENDILFENSSFDKDKDNRLTIGVSVIAVALVVIIAVVSLVIYKRRGRQQYSSVSGEDLEMTDNPHRSATNQIITETQNVTPRTGLLPNEVLKEIADRVSDDWKQLSVKLDINPDSLIEKGEVNTSKPAYQLLLKWKNLVAGATNDEIIDELRTAIQSINRWDIIDSTPALYCIVTENDLLHISEDLDEDWRKILPPEEVSKIETKNCWQSLRALRVLKETCTTSFADKLRECLRMINREDIVIKYSVLKKMEDEEGITEWSKREIECWKEDDKLFIETKAAREVEYILQNHNLVVVTGYAGTGKSYTVHHAALSLWRTKGYKIFFLSVTNGNFDNLEKLYKKNGRVFVIDDAFGQSELDKELVNSWKRLNVDRIFANDNNSKLPSKLLISTRNVMLEQVNDHGGLLKLKTCNLSSPNFRLSEDERTKMLQKYVKSDLIDKIGDCYHNVAWFPLLCKLSLCRETDEGVKNLFENPEILIEKQLESLAGNKLDTCAFVLCILFQEGFDLQWLEKPPKHYEDMISEIKKYFNTDMCSGSLAEQLNLHVHSFFKENSNIFTFIHEKLFEMSAVFFGKLHPKLFITHCSSHFIAHMFSSKCRGGDDCKGHNKICISSADIKEEYYERLKNDLRIGDLYSTFHNEELKSVSFRNEILQGLKERDIVEIFKGTKSGGKDKADDQLKKGHVPMIEAASEGLGEFVEYLIEIGCSVSHMKDGKTALSTACEKRHTNVVKLLLNAKADPIPFNMPKNPWIITCSKGNTEIAELLLKSMVEEEKIAPPVLLSGMNAASENGNMSIVEFLLDKYPDLISDAADNKETPLYLACKGGHANIVKILLQRGADVNKSVHSLTPLMVACRTDSEEVVNLLLDKNAGVNRVDNRFGKSALHITCANSNVTIGKMLLRKGADPFLCDTKVNSPIRIACKNMLPEIIDEILLENKDNLSRSDKYGRTLLFYASESGLSKVVHDLLDQGADPSISDKSEISPLHIASYEGFENVVKYLLSKGADASKIDWAGRTALFFACQGDNLKIVKILIDNMPEHFINKKDILSGKTPLFEACARGFRDIVKYLIERKADCCLKDLNEQTPFSVACEKGHLDIVELLYNTSNLDDGITKDDKSLLHLVCLNGCLDVFLFLKEKDFGCFLINDNSQDMIIEICHGRGQLLKDDKLSLCKLEKYKRIVDALIAKGFSPSAKDKNGKTPLHWSAYYNDTLMVKHLIKCQVDINVRDNEMQTPLFLACSKGNLDIVSILVENGANVDITTRMQASPIDVACRNGFYEIVTILIQSILIL